MMRSLRLGSIGLNKVRCILSNTEGLLFRAMDAYCKNIELADAKIQVLADKVAELKQLQVCKAVEAEKIRLASENLKLHRQIVDLKTKLSIAEIRNGKAQYSIPASTSSTTEAKIASPLTEGSSNSKVNDMKSEAPKSTKSKPEKPVKKAAPQQPKADSPVDISRIDLRIGRIVKAERHPDADTLYIEDCETGEEKNRTVISGLVNFIPIEEMQDRMVVLMMNLKPVKMRGIFSQAMVMCASSPEKVEILTPPPGCVPGDRVTFDGYPGEPDKQLNPKKKVWEQVQPDLKTNSDRVACYKGVPFTVAGKGVVTAQTMPNSLIK